MANDSTGCVAGSVSNTVVGGLGLVHTHCSGPENLPGALGSLGSPSSLVRGNTNTLNLDGAFLSTLERRMKGEGKTLPSMLEDQTTSMVKW